MSTWLPSALIALVCFGLWGILTKLTVFHIDSKSALVFQTLGVLIVGIITLTQLDFKPVTNFKGISYGILTGLAYGVGCMFCFIAADKGKANMVITLTALYPLITLFLSYILLKETINYKQCCGICFALIAIFLLS